jgi:hypothetical protein
MSIVRTALLAGALLASAPALAWTYETDDGRKVSNIQANRDGAACFMAVGRVDDPFVICMRSKGYIIHNCTFLGSPDAMRLGRSRNTTRTP